MKSKIIVLAYLALSFSACGKLVEIDAPHVGPTECAEGERLEEVSTGGVNVPLVGINGVSVTRCVRTELELVSEDELGEIEAESKEEEEF